MTGPSISSEDNSKSTSSHSHAHDDDDALRRIAFASLQPICSKLVAPGQTSHQLSSLLLSLHHVIDTQESVGIESCLDYILFPFQIILDAMTYHRTVSMEKKDRSISSGGTDSGVGRESLPFVSMTAAFSAFSVDKPSEAMLNSMLALFKKARCQRGEQLLSMLQRLSALLALPRDKTSEELRLLAVQCMHAVLHGSIIVNGKAVLVEGEREECNGSATAPSTPIIMTTAAAHILQEEQSAPLLGHLCSLLLQIAEQEASAGSTGSKTLRCTAFETLEVFFHAVDSAEALSYFLPGVVTGLCKALISSGSGGSSRRAKSGAAASGAAAVAALHALRAMLVCTLGNGSVCMTQEEEDSMLSTVAEPVLTSMQHTGNTDYIEASMHKLSLLAKKQHHKNNQENESATDVDEDKNENNPPQAFDPGGMPTHSERDRLRVQRTQEWVEGSTTRVHQLLSELVFPLLIADSRYAVRKAIVQGKE